jgi:hypothetical protein
LYPALPTPRCEEARATRHCNASAGALSDQVESPDRKEFAPIQKLGKHVLVGKAGPLFRDMLDECGAHQRKARLKPGF